MTRHIQPPDSVRETSRSKTRIWDIERALDNRLRDNKGYVEKFSLHGRIFVSTSGPAIHPFGGNLVLLVALLGIAGTTATTLQAYKNGVAAGGVLTIPATRKINMLKLTPVAYSALFDVLEIGILTPGTGAQRLTVYSIFDK